MQIFLSHAHKDYDDFVAGLVADLQHEHIEVWIDREGIAPGANWERTIRAAIQAADAVVFVATPNVLESKVIPDELTIADLLKKPIIPLWAKGEEWTDCVPLGRFHLQHIDARGAHYGQALKRLVKTLSGGAARDEKPPAAEKISDGAEPENPFRGLEAFREEHQRFYFGRAALSERLTERILNVAQSDSRLLAVVGASGSGKSSLVMAGLLPRLRRQNWRILGPFSPGARPLEGLAQTIARAVGSAGPVTILNELKNDPSARALHLWAGMIDPAPGILLVVDQFEEAFTQTHDEAEKQQFINLLARAAAEPRGPLTIALTLRADFQDRPLNYPELTRPIEGGLLLVPAMTLSELAEAVQGPAALAGLTFADGLAGEIVFALSEKRAALAGALPLLQFALDRLYAERDGRTLTRSAYDAMGGVEGAIGHHAEAVFNALDAEAQNALDAVFPALVNPDEPPTRKRAALASLTANETSRRLVEALIAGRLLLSDSLPGGEPFVEVAHEALLTRWTRLAAWIEKSAGDLRLMEKVTAAAHEWDTLGRPERKLWLHEDQLPVYEMQQRRPDWTPDEATAAFLVPEAERLLAEFADEGTKYYRKMSIMYRWREIGEAAVTQIVEALPWADWLGENAFFNPLIDALKPFADVVVPDIISLLTSESWSARNSAVWALTELDDRQAVEPLIAALNHQDVDVRRLSIKVLGRLKDSRAVEPLSYMLKDKTLLPNSFDNARVQYVAASALESIGTNDAKTVLNSWQQEYPDDYADWLLWKAWYFGKMNHRV